MSSYRLKFRRMGDHVTHVMASTRVRISKEETKKIEFLAAVVTDLRKAADIADASLRDGLSPDMEALARDRRYFVKVYRQPRNLVDEDRRGFVHIPAAYCCRPTKTQANDYIKDYFGVD